MSKNSWHRDTTIGRLYALMCVSTSDFYETIMSCLLLFAIGSAKVLRQRHTNICHWNSLPIDEGLGAEILEH